MIHYGYYSDVPPGALDALVDGARLCRLVTIGEGVPHLGLYPFIRAPGGFTLHLHKGDEQVADLRARPRCLLEIDELLADIPSHWIDAEDGSFATAYHKTAAFECTATVVAGAAEVAEVQRGFLARYQPEGGHRPMRADDPLYTETLAMLVGIRLTALATKVKFKLGQNRDLETRGRIAKLLRERGAALDLRTADALDETIRLGWTTKGVAKRS